MAKQGFQKISVKGDLKREIDTVAGHEQRPVYEIVEEAWKLYKLVAVGKSPAKKAKSIPSVPVADIVAISRGE